MLVKNESDIKSKKQIIKKLDKDIVVKGKKINKDVSDSDFTNDSDSSNASDISDEDSEKKIQIPKYKKSLVKNYNNVNNKKKLVIDEDSSDSSDSSDCSDYETNSSDYESDPDNPLYKE